MFTSDTIGTNTNGLIQTGYSSSVPLYATRRTFWMDVRASGSFEMTILRTRL